MSTCAHPIVQSTYLRLVFYFTHSIDYKVFQFGDLPCNDFSWLLLLVRLRFYERGSENRLVTCLCFINFLICRNEQMQKKEGGTLSILLNTKFFIFIITITSTALHENLSFVKERFNKLAWFQQPAWSRKVNHGRNAYCASYGKNSRSTRLIRSYRPVFNYRCSWIIKEGTAICKETRFFLVSSLRSSL